MTLRKLQPTDDGTWPCPVCGRPLRFSDGGAVAVVNGKLDMENYKPRYECDNCQTFYREVMSTGYYDVFPLAPEHPDEQPGKQPDSKEEKNEANELPVADEKAPPLTRKNDHSASVPVPLPEEADGSRRCPKCHRKFRFVDGGAVRVVNGKVDMENTKPKYECDSCGVYYREIMTSGYYLPYPQTEEDLEGAQADKSKAKPKNFVRTGDIPPTLLKRDENNKCKCPRCGEMMDYVEGGAVRLVDGKPFMDDIWDHFVCDECGSVYRRIVGTDYFQWSEK